MESNITGTSDITVIMCLQKNYDDWGSQVLFYGVQRWMTCMMMRKCLQIVSSFKFLQEKIPGYAMIPGGHHPHQAMPLQDRRCTNIDPTYCKLQLRHFPQQYNTWTHNTLDNLSLQSEFVTNFFLGFLASFFVGIESLCLNTLLNATILWVWHYCKMPTCYIILATQ